MPLILMLGTAGGVQSCIVLHVPLAAFLAVSRSDRYYLLRNVIPFLPQPWGIMDGERKYSLPEYTLRSALHGDCSPAEHGQPRLPTLPLAR